MFFKIISAHDCLAFDLTKLDVVRMEYNDQDLSDNRRHVIAMYAYKQESPVIEYDVTKLSLDRRHELFDRIVQALELPHIEDADTRGQATVFRV